MTEPTPTPQLSTDPQTYQPISGWAIAGFVAGIAFALLVAMSAAIAFYQGAPFFFRDWVFGLPILGLALSYYGRIHVENSEGTQAGAALATWGMRLSLVSAVVYFSYYYFTGIAIQGQANDFVMEMKDDDTGYLPRLLAASTNRNQHNAAFLLTQSPNSRGVRPENEKELRERYDKPNTRDGSSGLLTSFRERDALARALYKQTDKDVVITPMSVRKWPYDKRSYRVERVYHVKTKEIEFDYLLVAMSVEAEGPGQSRKWFVNLMESHQIPDSTTLTRFGEGLVRLRTSAKDVLQQRLQGIRDAKPTPFPDWEKLAKKQDWDPLPIDPPSKRDERRGQFQDMLAGRGELKLNNEPILLTPPELPGRWEQVDGKIRVALMFKTTLNKTAQQLPVYLYEAVATLETRHPVDPAKFDGSTPVEWNVTDLEVVSVHAILEKK